MIRQVCFDGFPWKYSVSWLNLTTMDVSFSAIESKTKSYPFQPYLVLYCHLNMYYTLWKCAWHAVFGCFSLFKPCMVLFSARKCWIFLKLDVSTTYCVGYDLPFSSWLVKNCFKDFFFFLLKPTFLAIYRICCLGLFDVGWFGTFLFEHFLMCWFYIYQIVFTPTVPVTFNW